MNKLLITLAFILISALPVNAQSLFGVKGGVNVSYMNIESRESLVSFHAGLFSRIPLSEKYFLQPELLYSVKGAKFPGYFYYFDMNITFSYISMPILFGWKATDHLLILAGPEFSYLVSNKVAVNEYGPNVTGSFSAIDVGLDLGVAYLITKRIGAELRFSYGLVNVPDLYFTDANGQSLGGLNEGKNRTVQLSVNYLLVKG